MGNLPSRGLDASAAESVNHIKPAN